MILRTETFSDRKASELLVTDTTNVRRLAYGVGHGVSVGCLSMSPFAAWAFGFSPEFSVWFGTGSIACAGMAVLFRNADFFEKFFDTEGKELQKYVGRAIQFDFAMHVAEQIGPVNRPVQRAFGGGFWNGIKYSGPGFIARVAIVLSVETGVRIVAGAQPFFAVSNAVLTERWGEKPAATIPGFKDRVERTMEKIEKIINWRITSGYMTKNAAKEEIIDMLEKNAPHLKMIYGGLSR